MFLQRAGYRLSGEAVACHSRRRYRLLPGNPAHGLPNPDSSLWLTHYSKASPRDHVPAQSIAIPPHVQALIQQRRLIQSQGQLPRKEFMLQDRSNWPVIHLPQGFARAAAQAPMPPGPGHRRGTSIAQEATVEEEEDVSRGDLLDFMTPRDISRVRYEQHHEWMEEIIESPYPTSSIIPSDLGFGRKGQLEELTKDFFDAPVSATREASNGPPPRVGRMAAGQADEFIKRASVKLAAMEAELQELRKRHARRMEKLRRSTTLTLAEKQLRTAPYEPERRSISKDATNGDATAPARDAIDEIMSTVESDMGQKLKKTTTVTMISKGGLEERKKVIPVPVEPPVPAAPVVGDTVNTPSSANATVGSQPLPQPQPPKPAVPENEPTSAPASVQPSTTSENSVEAESGPASTSPPIPKVEAEPTPDSGETKQEGDLPSLDNIDADVDMDGMDDQAITANQDGDEWVMIGDDGAQNEAEIPDTKDSDEADLVPSASEQQPDAPSTSLAQQPPTQSNEGTQLNTPDFDMGGDFDNVDVDTAGDALASYDNDEDLNLDSMEGSAFGDAFHPEDEDIS